MFCVGHLIHGRHVYAGGGHQAPSPQVMHRPQYSTVHVSLLLTEYTSVDMGEVGRGSYRTVCYQLRIYVWRAIGLEWNGFFAS
jgi:hypothetical protein